MNRQGYKFNPKLPFWCQIPLITNSNGWKNLISSGKYWSLNFLQSSCLLHFQMSLSKNFATQNNCKEIFLGKEKALCFVSQSVQLCIKNLSWGRVKSERRCLLNIYFLPTSSSNQLYPLFKAYIYLNYSSEGMNYYITDE